VNNNEDDVLEKNIELFIEKAFKGVVEFGNDDGG
jgi:hypothetical protein